MIPDGHHALRMKGFHSISSNEMTSRPDGRLLPTLLSILEISSGNYHLVIVAQRFVIRICHIVENFILLMACIITLGGLPTYPMANPTLQLSVVFTTSSCPYFFTNFKAERPLLLLDLTFAQPSNKILIIS